MKGKILILGLLAAGMFGCRDRGNARVADVGPGGWPVEVVYENQDTTSLRTLSLLVRLRTDFGYDRLDLVVETVTPDNLHWTDTVVVVPGELEVVSFTYRDIKTPYRSAVVLDRPGAYRFRFDLLRPGAAREKIIGAGIVIND